MNHHSPSFTSDVSGKELHGLRFRVMLKPGGEQAKHGKLSGRFESWFHHQKAIMLNKKHPPIALLRVIHTLTLICHSFYISSGNIDGMIFWHSILEFYLAFYLTFYSDILFWQSIWHLLWHPIWLPLWHLYWHVRWHSIWYFVCHIFWHTFWHAIWHSMWHSILAFYLASILTFFSGFLSGISSGILCGWGRREHSDPELPVDVRRGMLWSGACGGGPAGNTLIWSLWWRSGGERSDPELVVGNTLIRSLRWRPGGEDCNLEIAVEVRWSKEEEGVRRRAAWHKI